MTRNPGGPILTWKLSLIMGMITATVLAGGLIARPWFQEKPASGSLNRPQPRRIRSLPTPQERESPRSPEDANLPPRMPHVDDLSTPPRKGILKR
ncbi:MAG TPA: hypothetical protein VGX70_04020 [Gemmataceae bacterium]|nr:hypothetical protein [Gemmataceae bacterium]